MCAYIRACSDIFDLNYKEKERNYECIIKMDLVKKIDL